jgi:two-component system OmpR family sensor kinase
MSEPRGSRSLESRLRVKLLALIGAMWLLAALVTWFGLRGDTNDVLDDTLLETAEQLLALPDAALGDGSPPPAALEVGRDDSDIVLQVLDGSGRLRMRSHSAPAKPLITEPGDGVIETEQWHAVSLTHPNGSRRVLVAEARAHRRQTLAQLNTWLVVPVAILLPLTAAVLQRLLRQAFQSLEPIRENLANRAPHELYPVDLSNAPRELQPMLETFNAMMARVQTLIDAERTFAAHTAHELRTPLAAARAQAQRLVQEAQKGNAAQLTERAQALVRQLDRLTRLATRLLQLARIESGVALKREPVDLLQLAHLVADEFGGACSQGQLCVHASADGEPVQGDIDALGIALRNLIDNALKHGGENTRVRVLVGPHSLAVQDTGVGIQPDQLGQLSQPFQRGRTVAEGSGLGLAMVQTVARQSGAQLVLRSLDESEGEWRFEVSLVFAPGTAAQPAATAGIGQMQPA